MDSIVDDLGRLIDKIERGEIDRNALEYDLDAIKTEVEEREKSWEDLRQELIEEIDDLKARNGNLESEVADMREYARQFYNN